MNSRANASWGADHCSDQHFDKPKWREMIGWMKGDNHSAEVASIAFQNAYNFFAII